MTFLTGWSFRYKKNWSKGNTQINAAGTAVVLGLLYDYHGRDSKSKS
jgi:hypothetical protein